MKLEPIKTSDEALELMEKSADELNELVATAHGWTEKTVFGEEPAFVDEDGVIVQLVSEYNPAGNWNFAFELVRELNDAGYVIAINTHDAATLERAIIVGGFPTRDDLKPLPLVRVDVEPEGVYKNEVCRAICMPVSYTHLRAHET